MAQTVSLNVLKSQEDQDAIVLLMILKGTPVILQQNYKYLSIPAIPLISSDIRKRNEGVHILKNRKLKFYSTLRDRIGWSEKKCLYLFLCINLKINLMGPH